MKAPGGVGGSNDSGDGERRVPAEQAGGAASRTRERRRRSRASRASRGDAPASYRRILVPLDGTPFAEAALTPAAALAARAGATLDLVSVMARGDTSLDLGEAVQTAEPGSLEFAERLEEYVLRAMERVESEWGCEVTSGVLPEGEPGAALRRYVERTGADLTVAAARTDGAATDALLGELPSGLVREAPCTLLLIPASAAGVQGGEGPLHGPVRSVVALLEGAEASDREVVKHAVRMARLWGAPLRVLERGEGEEAGGVARWMEELDGHDLDIEVERSAEAGGVDGVDEFLDRHQADLVCVPGDPGRPLRPLFGAAAEEDADEHAGRAGVLICSCA